MAYMFTLYTPQQWSALKHGTHLPDPVPPEARKDDLGLLERTVLPKGVCQPQRHGSWINSLGSFKLGNLPHLWGASKVFEIVVVENGTTS